MFARCGKKRCRWRVRLLRTQPASAPHCAPILAAVLLIFAAGCGGTSRTDAEQAAVPFNDPLANVDTDGRNLTLTYPDGSTITITMSGQTCFDFQAPGYVTAVSAARANHDLRLRLHLAKCDTTQGETP